MRGNHRPNLSLSFATISARACRVAIGALSNVRSYTAFFDLNALYSPNRMSRSTLSWIARNTVDATFAGNGRGGSVGSFDKRKPSPNASTPAAAAAALAAAEAAAAVIGREAEVGGGTGTTASETPRPLRIRFLVIRAVSTRRSRSPGPVVAEDRAGAAVEVEVEVEEEVEVEVERRGAETAPMLPMRPWPVRPTDDFLRW